MCWHRRFKNNWWWAASILPCFLFFAVWSFSCNDLTPCSVLMKWNLQLRGSWMQRWWLLLVPWRLLVVCTLDKWNTICHEMKTATLSDACGGLLWTLREDVSSGFVLRVNILCLHQFMGLSRDCTKADSYPTVDVCWFNFLGYTGRQFSQPMVQSLSIQISQKVHEHRSIFKQ